MEKIITVQVKPRFLLVIKTASREYVEEFETEKELRARALDEAVEDNKVVAYRIAGRAEATSYPALNLKWR